MLQLLLRTIIQNYIRMHDKQFAFRLESWYVRHGRELPWRNTTDPYLIWVSEVILQQTRVAQGYDYFQRFVTRFPSVDKLASASEDEVLKYWQGLGYYSRARNLHEAARQIMSEWGGRFPDTYDGIRSLKGVGDYTAAAIASFAFGLPHAVVDGNVYRVLARYLDIDVPIDSAQGRKLFAQLAREMMDTASPAVYNQAIMDFGAIQCTPKSPRCLLCPLADSCAGLAAGRVAELPVKSHVTKVTTRFFTYLYIRSSGKVALHRRDEGDIWQGLYEPLLLETEAPLSLAAICAHPVMRSMLASCSGDGAAEQHPGCMPVCLRRGVRHQLSHRLLVADFYLLQLPQKPADAEWNIPGMQWVGEEELDRYAVPRLIDDMWDEVKCYLSKYHD